MITREYRSLSDVEVKNLRRSFEWERFKVSGFVGTAFLALVLYAGSGWFLGRAIDWLVFSMLLKHEGTRLFAFVLLTIGVLLASYSVIRDERTRRTWYRASRRSVERAISDGRVEIISCDVTRAVELSEFEDEGPGYFLEIGSDLLMFIQGQHLFELDCVPCAKVTLTRVADSKKSLDFTCSGPHIVPVRTIQSRQFGGAPWLSDGLVFRAALEEIPESLSDWPPRDDALDEALSATK